MIEIKLYEQFENIMNEDESDHEYGAHKGENK